MRPYFSVLALLLCGLSAAQPFQAQEIGNPPALALDGSTALQLVAQARRGHLLGTVDFYTIGIYADGPTPDRVGLSSPKASKAIRIQVTYEQDVRRRLTLDWRRELVPPLDPAAAALLRGTFAALERGDVVRIEYVPAKGTAVRVNRLLAVSEGHHELMLAFLDHWIGQRPVSEEIKRTLLAPPGAGDSN